jgi:ferredoxin-thioredoxin reductase catalytic subunit
MMTRYLRAFMLFHTCVPLFVHRMLVVLRIPLCRSGTYFCVDKSVTAVVIQGLAEHKDTLGAPLCPCRHYDDKEAEAQMGYWNCPCVPMRERKVGSTDDK